MVRQRSGHSMIARLFGILGAALVALSCAATQAAAHPHVFVTMKSEMVYDASGAITAVRHIWTFDDMFSTYATQGLESKQKGVFTREELAPLAEVNVTSLKEYDYFTYLKGGDKKAAFHDATDYWLEFNDSMLTLHFTLALKTPLKAQQVRFEVYDPTYFVAFGLADKDPVVLAGAPAACKLTITKPSNSNANQSARLGEAFFNSMGSLNWGAQFADMISVNCP
jgi:ABC-type uncharacterized transport system substrate-binding protein